ncbi:MAG: YggS family pyridoxal phosphate-dependent enzyme [Gammaproteobacteria bacterium]|nr:YggS family pyridoxal phosphate-dependent enzyme [Gammaproteobacteria bacterium]NND53734.1 YggS family pyridoxal phosphate-dependent enzyme [Gammaproteobacteria bacterium]
MTRITKHLVNLQNRISAACARAGRNENDVSVLAVSKRHPVAAVREAYAAGLHAMGENYLQDALQKIPECPPGICWHYIGRVQSNKTRALAEHFDWIQTVASPKVARRLSEQRPADLTPLNICVQVNTDRDADPNHRHGGVEPAAAGDLCELIAGLPNLRLRGLMTIPRPAAGEAEQREPFARLHALYDECNTAGLGMDTLSMGMTNDLEAAILEGSTMVRVGTALFGPRPD